MCVCVCVWPLMQQLDAVLVRFLDVHEQSLHLRPYFLRLLQNLGQSRILAERNRIEVSVFPCLGKEDPTQPKINQ